MNVREPREGFWEADTECGASAHVRIDQTSKRYQRVAWSWKRPGKKWRKELRAMTLTPMEATDLFHRKRVALSAFLTEQQRLADEAKP